MKLRNKETGQLGKISKTWPDEQEIEIITDTKVYFYNSITEVCKHWEDYEKPKEYWWIDYGGRIKAMNDSDDEEDKARKQIGNYFETKEEAEKAVEKLKAWKRLKDNGFKFLDYTALGAGEIKFEHNVMDEIEDVEQLENDLDLLFGGEE